MYDGRHSCCSCEMDKGVGEILSRLCGQIGTITITIRILYFNLFVYLFVQLYLLLNTNKSYPATIQNETLSAVTKQASLRPPAFFSWDMPNHLVTYPTIPVVAEAEISTQLIPKAAIRHNTSTLLFEVSPILKTTSLRTMTAFWDVAPCSLVEVDWRFGGAYCLHQQNEQHKKNLFGFFLELVSNQNQLDQRAQKIHFPVLSTWWQRQYTSLKRRSTPTRLHGVISQKSSLYSPPWEHEISTTLLAFNCPAICFSVLQLDVSEVSVQKFYMNSVFLPSLSHSHPTAVSQISSSQHQLACTNGNLTEYAFVTRLLSNLFTLYFPMRILFS
jgi:hypothetical protein